MPRGGRDRGCGLGGHVGSGRHVPGGELGSEVQDGGDRERRTEAALGLVNESGPDRAGEGRAGAVGGSEAGEPPVGT